MSLHNAKHFTRPLALASAAFLLHIGAATAGDIQGQMNALLAGTVAAHSATQSGPRDGTATTPTANTQESIRQVLLGTTGSRVGNTATSARTASETKSRERLAAYGDRQAAVRQVLLGQRNARDAS